MRDLVEGGSLRTLRLQQVKLADLAEQVEKKIRENYPDLQIPPDSCWRSMERGGIDRFGILTSSRAFETEQAFFRAAADLAVMCTLADGLMPEDWTFLDPLSGERMEGRQAGPVAAAVMFASGAFSSDPADPFRADAFALSRITQDEVMTGFQFGGEAHAGTAEKLARQFNRLGEIIALRPDLFEDGQEIRPAILMEQARIAMVGPVLPVGTLFDAVLDGFAPIWDGGAEIGDRILGDVWPASMEDTGADGERVAFHLPAAAMCLNMIEPFGWTGCGLSELDKLPAPSDADHAAVMVDAGVLIINTGETADPARLAAELRASTMILTDDLARMVRGHLGVSEEDLPLACILEAGTRPLAQALLVKNPELLARLGRNMNPGGVFWLPFGA
ncbi:DUF1688 family protein [Roseibium sp. RKSG952]|uniref:DUF1688 family protein n=1 Tax=Roseibium sp. RKSG952 TaxID=2529384 RepID=UPI0018AD2AC9|nr:DUF1688 family protein [Roseibium sp. RKSG952]